MDINILLFNDFEPLDVFGPAEVFLHSNGFNVKYFSYSDNNVTSSYGLPFVDILSDDNIDQVVYFWFLVVRAPGHWSMIKKFIKKLTNLIESSTYCLTVCTGSALLAKTTVLNYKNATSNKLAFDWVASLNTKVSWQRQARWSVDGKFYTSSGVSAGIDMSLSFIENLTTRDFADNVANNIEYVRIKDSTLDPFS